MTDIATEYLRRSSGKQEASLEQQIEINAAYIERKGYTRAAGQERFTETMSGKTFDRPEFQRLVTLVTSNQNKFNTIIMYKPNRMGRAKHIEEFFYYEFILTKHGVKIEYALNDECNLEGIAGFMMRGLNYQAAAQYIIDLSNDTTRGLLYNAERGFHFGGEPCYGYDRMLVDMQGNHLGILHAGMHKSDRRDLKVIYVKRTDGLPEFLAEQVWQEAVKNGWGASQTAYHLNELIEKDEGRKPQKAGRRMTRKDGTVLDYSDFWAPSTIKEMWRRTTYVGWRTVTIETDNEFQGEERICKNAHEPIVEENLFWTLFERDSKRIWNIPKSQYREEAVKYPLTRKGRCFQCKEYFMGALTSHGRGKVRYYRDRGAFKKCCPTKDWSVPAEQLEEAVFGIILADIRNGNYAERITLFVSSYGQKDQKVTLEEQRTALVNEGDATKRGIQNLLTLAKERPDSKHLLAELDALEAQERTLERKIREMDASIQRCEPIDFSELERYCAAIEYVQDLQRRREIFQTFVKEFGVDKVKKQIDITFYSIPLLPVVRNLLLEQQEQGVTYSLPEHVVQISYRKRRFVVPREYEHIHEPLKEDHLSSERRDRQQLKDREAMRVVEQLRLFSTQ
jgi:DNA invertase Pin-like site-specific DNA recombinase